MQLLVSVSNATEAAAALAGGADFIDAKDPLRGVLGPVTPPILRDIQAVVAARRPVTAALGDAVDSVALEMAAREFSRAGVQFIKVGFAAVGSEARIRTFLAAATRGASERSRAGVVAVAYADDEDGVSPFVLLRIAAELGAAGLLVDTRHKERRGLRELAPKMLLADLISATRKSGLFVALAGRLMPRDLAWARSLGADIAGVRGAACDGGRTGRIAATRVADLKKKCGPSLDQAERVVADNAADSSP